MKRMALGRRSFVGEDAKPEYRRAGVEVINRMVMHGRSFLSFHPVRVAVLAFLAGCYICFGATVGIMLAEGLPPGAQKFMIGFGFVGGFSMVILSGAALFTEVNVSLPVYLLYCLDVRVKDAGYIRAGFYWFLVNVCNFAGALCTSALLNGAGVLDGEPSKILSGIVTKKLKDTDDGVLGWFIVVLSGMLANWLVGMAAINASSARTVIGKISGVFFPVLMFAVIGLQHSPANMGYMFLGLIDGSDAVSWGKAIGFNIIPSGIGNLIGAFFFVALPFWYVLKCERFPNNLMWKKDILPVYQTGAHQEGGEEPTETSIEMPVIETRDDSPMAQDTKSG